MQNTAQKIRRFTPEEYLAIDRASDTKYEYIAGEILAMSGASLNHNFVVANLIRLIGNHVVGTPCVVLPSDMRVHAYEGNSYFYPDVVVVYGKPQLTPHHADTLTNPTVIIEVLSPSTELFDRGTKFSKYQQIPLLKEYVLVSQEHPFVEVFTHQKGNLWLYAAYAGLDAEVLLSSVNGTFLASEIYLNVDFPSIIEEESPS